MHEYVANIIIQYALNCNDQFIWGLVSLPGEISILIYWRTEPKIHLAYFMKNHIEPAQIHLHTVAGIIGR